MFDTDIFLSSNPAEPWSFYPFGLPALGLVALGLVLLTLWTYLGHPQASRRRILLVLLLRLAALVVILLTALRPSVGIQEDPKLPSVLLIGVDLSESMTVPDELNNQPRINAVRKVLERCQSTLDELRDEQKVNVVLYGFGPADFNPDGGLYHPAAPAKYPRSDYGTYLNRTFDRWQTERFVRGHLIIGDGQDNGVAFRPEAEAARWRQTGRQVHTFGVGSTLTQPDARDVALTSANVTSGNPDGSVFIKTEFTLRVTANAFGFVGSTPPIEVRFDEGEGYKLQLTQTVTLAKEKDNEFELKLKAPDRPGEIKLRIEIPVASVPGDVAPSNNVIETYLTVTKEGMRVLYVDRISYELPAINHTLAADKRIDLYPVIRQTDQPATPSEREDFDFDKNAYDVIILGNVSAKQLTSIDPALPRRIADQVLTRGVGLLMLGGHATFTGTPGYPDATGWRGTKEIEDILPVDLAGQPPVSNDVFTKDTARFQFLPVVRNANHYLVRLADTPEESAAQWRKLNDPANRVRFTGLSKIGTPKPNATLFAVASDDRGQSPVPLPDAQAAKLAPLLVGHQIGVGNRGRVLVMAAQDTRLWMKLGQPKSNDGIQLHARFWRQMVRWLAHQEEDEGAAFAKPDWRRGPVGAKQSIRVGLRQPGGTSAVEPKFDVKVLAPGEDEAAAKPISVVTGPDGGWVVPYDPKAPGEYTVKLAAYGKSTDGKEVRGEATARFLAYPEASDEMLRKAADHEVLKRIAAAGGGQFRRLEELPAFLRELKGQPLEAVKPKPRYVPDWRVEKSQGFLPAWLIVFAALLGTEWGLRRYWGMV
jgi:hypothetical protein